MDGTVPWDCEGASVLGKHCGFLSAFALTALVCHELFDLRTHVCRGLWKSLKT